MAIAAPDTLDSERQALAESCFPMAKMLAGRYAHRHELDPDECESVAMYALTSSARTFDHDRGVKFSSLAYTGIRKALWQRHRRGELSLLRGPGRTPRRVWSLIENAHTDRSGETPVDVAIRHETAAAMRDAMSEVLTEKQDTYIRRSFAGSDFRKVGASLGRQGSGVGQTVRDGFRRLRALAERPLIFHSFRGVVCPSCGCKKRALRCLCRACAGELPESMLRSLRAPHVNGYADALVAALIQLETRGPFWSEPAKETAS